MGSSAAALASFLALVTPWIIQRIEGLTLLTFLEHETCQGDDGLCSVLSAQSSIASAEGACLGDTACLNTFAYTHVATVFAAGGAAFATAAMVIVVARPPMMNPQTSTTRAVATLHFLAATFELIAWSVYGATMFPLLEQAAKANAEVPGISQVVGPGLAFSCVAMLLAAMCTVLTARIICTVGTRRIETGGKPLMQVRGVVCLLWLAHALAWRLVFGP